MPSMQPLTLTADEATFLAARLRRLFAHFDCHVPDFADNDASLIRVAGSCIGGLLANQAEAKPVGSIIKGALRDAPGPWCREVLLYSPDNQGDSPEYRVMLYARPGGVTEVQGQTKPLSGTDAAKPRLLTMIEVLQARDNHGVNESEAESIQRKFCKVNGIALSPEER